jgi:bifunctional N-acetylglucosamine-1-phosphate-uridyltransferase/glucosamine-1-phosphate-acetyltransferase GlmU-like protein
VETAQKSGAHPIIAIVGHKRDLVMKHLGDRVRYAIQEPQLGTGHAVLQTEPLLKDFQGEVLILSGDVPLLKEETIRRLTSLHYLEENVCTIVTCIFTNPTGYGRIIRGTKGEVLGIVEQKDASAEQKKINEINSGIYFVSTQLLFQALHTLKTDNAQKEYYITDIIPYFRAKNLRIGGLTLDEPLEIAGVNSVAELKALEEEYLRRNIIID